MKHHVDISATMEGVGPIRPEDQVFLLVKRCTKGGETMSREQYPAKCVMSYEIDPDPEKAKAEDYQRRLADAPDIVIDYED